MENESFRKNRERSRQPLMSGELEIQNEVAIIVKQVVLQLVFVHPVPISSLSLHLLTDGVKIGSFLPGIRHGGDVSAQEVRARQRAEEVQRVRAEGAHGAVRAAAEDQLVRHAQAGGLRRLRATRRLGLRWNMKYLAIGGT